MTRQEAHFDAMLRHLGAMYYHTLRGEGTASDVAKALESVEREMARQSGGPGEPEPERPMPRTGRWRVRDVMTTHVVAVDKHASSAEIARLLSGHHVNALPVLTGERRVAGVVSEADLLRTQHRPGAKTRLLRGRRPHAASPRDYTAAQLMTSPAVTIHPDAPVGAAARRMTGGHFTLLPVVDDKGELIGVVSRRDLLDVFLRPDEDIAAEVAHVLADLVLIDANEVEVTARDGLVTLTGRLGSRDQMEAAIRLAGEVDGVLAVVDKITVPGVGNTQPV